MAATVDNRVISAITDKEKQLTHQPQIAQDGPTATAQSHQGELLTSHVVSDIAKGESNLHPGQSTQAGGPAAIAQSMAARSTVDAQFISAMSEKEKEITHKADTVETGPTAAAQSHEGQRLTGQIVSDIAKGEVKIHPGEAIHAGGPTALAQSILAMGNNTNRRPRTSNGSLRGQPTSSEEPNRSENTSNATNGTSATVKLDGPTISNVAEAEKKITNSDNPTQGGPTATAQSHAGEDINSQTLHDVTMGEKKVTGGEMIKGGPTSTLQSEVSQVRQ